MLTTDRVSGIALVLFSLLVMWQSRLLPLGTLRQPGPAYIPIILALLLLIFGVCLVVTARRAPLLSSLGWPEWRHALAILAVCVFAALGMERLGYRVTMLVVLIVLLRIMEKCSGVLTVAFALFLSFGSFFLFHTILRVPLPLGRFGL
jgi:Tripartite tricarboxylate transporter TctB family